MGYYDNAYCSSVPIGVAQKFDDGKPNNTVDSQHNVDGVYANITKPVNPITTADTTFTSNKLYLMWIARDSLEASHPIFE